MTTPPDPRPYYRVDPAMDRYVPNHIPGKERLWNVLLSLLLLAYGAYGLWADDLYIPGKRRSGIHLHGIAAWVMFAAIVAAALNLLSVVIDHYDRRNNERDYRAIAFGTQVAGWTLFGTALFVHVLRR